MRWRGGSGSGPRRPRPARVGLQTRCWRRGRSRRGAGCGAGGERLGGHTRPLRGAAPAARLRGPDLAVRVCRLACGPATSGDARVGRWERWNCGPTQPVGLLPALCLRARAQPGDRAGELAQGRRRAGARQRDARSKAGGLAQERAQTRSSIAARSPLLCRPPSPARTTARHRPACLLAPSATQGPTPPRALAATPARATRQPAPAALPAPRAGPSGRPCCAARAHRARPPPTRPRAPHEQLDQLASSQQAYHQVWKVPLYRPGPVHPPAPATGSCCRCHLPTADCLRLRLHPSTFPRSSDVQRGCHVPAGAGAQDLAQRSPHRLRGQAPD
jgi:hypothetical protein